jgi:tRNA pseudouridine55 synthase
VIDGFVLVDKPSGWTSHDVVGKIRRLAGQKKVGHAGTLDPMATGLVIVGLGRCTRLLRFVQDQPKEYVTTAVFGVATDSLDADGAILSREPMEVEPGDVEAVLDRFCGPILQIPPMVSAVRVGGRRLYEMARKGEEIEREARPVTVYDLEIEDFAPGAYPEVTLRVQCGSGTYIRVLADDIARALGGRAHLTALRRTVNGGHTVAAAHSMDELVAAEEAGRFHEMVLSPLEGLPELTRVDVDEETARAAGHGMKFTASSFPDSGSDAFRMVHEGRLIAVYRVDGTVAKAEVVLS